MKKDVKVQMVEEFQCPGCSLGSDTQCGRFEMKEVSGNFRCGNHGTGTMFGYGPCCRTVALGMPTGFNKGFEHPEHSIIVLYENPNHFKGFLDFCNIAFWALEQNGYLFVRIYQPRLNRGIVAVIKDGKRSELCPDTLDVGTFPEGAID